MSSIRWRTQAAVVSGSASDPAEGLPEPLQTPGATFPTRPQLGGTRPEVRQPPKPVLQTGRAIFPTCPQPAQRPSGSSGSSADGADSALGSSAGGAGEGGGRRQLTA